MNANVLYPLLSTMSRESLTNHMYWLEEEMADMTFGSPMWESFDLELTETYREMERRGYIQ